MPRVISLAVIAGDGIGPEVITEAVKVLHAVAPADVTIETTPYPFGAGHYLETGEILSDADIQSLTTHDAILLGAVGGDPRDPRLKGGIIERGLLLKLRFALDHYVNLRPTTLFPSVESPLSTPGDVDFVVVREGTEGPYVATAVASASVHRTRSPTRYRSTRPSVSNASCASVSRRPPSARRRS